MSDEQGARGILQGYHHCLFKNFSDYATAQMSYNKMEQSGVLELVKSDPQHEEVFIVTKGTQPGVYSKR
ncbi:hypothetical protein BT96DRAFT_836880 [Gymnopus androsaceus JB14]|uniref:Uncharacterized protein n=1 Tax=Gymnopus androsaceus JB14 TaxID=1447944 RepID=A0A6A4GQI7_9AGAR|nr:hypothetical protein BT96DRAFT_836880 [Gymnopus androsaceus JB14]